MPCHVSHDSIAVSRSSLLLFYGEQMVIYTSARDKEDESVIMMMIEIFCMTYRLGHKTVLWVYNMQITMCDVALLNPGRQGH